MRFQDNQVMEPKELGQRIRQARERLGISQDDFAVLIERDQRAVSEYEHGKRRISVTDLPKFADALQVPLLYFFEGQLNPNDLDRELLEYFHQLPSIKSKQSAIQIVRILTEVCD